MKRGESGIDGKKGVVRDRVGEREERGVLIYEKRS